MKINLLLPLTLTCALLIGSCKKENDDRECNSPNCPDIFTCKIDGEHWSIQTSAGSCRDIVANYYPDGYKDLEPGFLGMLGRDCKSDYYSSVSIVINRIQSPMIIDLKDTSSVKVFPSRVDDRVYEYPADTYDKIVDGEINVTLIQADNYGDQNTQKGRVKGRFWMTLYNEVNDTIRITDGVFDVALP